MGTLSGLLYQGLAPVFADVDAGTLNIDPTSVRRRITGRTRAIVAVHHSGLSADMDELLSIVREAGIPVLEDCAQAYCCVSAKRRYAILSSWRPTTR
jgi:dTDP-4-amino-4,6-dideoxygalactose transaminase